MRRRADPTDQRHARCSAPRLLHQPDTEHRARPSRFAADWRALDIGCPSTGQLHRAGHRPIVAAEHVGGVGQQRLLLGSIEDEPHVLVHHHDVVVDRQHRSAGLLTRLEVLLEQREFAQACLGQ